MHQVDSLQEAANEARWKTEKLRLEEMLQNKELSNQLLLQKEQTASARRMQYLLLTLVVILAASLLAAVLWWRHHRRRLRRLFMLIALRHADWLRNPFTSDGFLSSLWQMNRLIHKSTCN